MLLTNQKLSLYGINNNLVVGVNMKKIIIRKYDMKNRKDLKVYL